MRSLASRHKASRLVWITNLSAPYRWPVWRSIAAKFPFAVGLLADTEPNRRWPAELPEGVARHKLRVGTLRSSTAPVYFLWRLALRGCGRGDAVVLPGWEHPAAWQLLAEAKLRGVATIAFYESHLASQRFGSGSIAVIRKWFFTQVDAVLTVGEASRAAVISFGVAPERIATTHNTIDMASPLDAPLHACPKTDLDSKFVFVGQLIRRKNVEALFRALAQCPAHYVLEVVGEGPLSADLKKMSDDLGIAERVTFTGYLEPKFVAEHILRAGTLVLPSVQEVYGLVALEALARGRHVIVSASAGVSRDIVGMPGVWTVGPTVVELALAMRHSSADWTGPIDSPTVLKWTPWRFASDTLHAVEIGLSRRQGRNRSGS